MILRDPRDLHSGKIPEERRLFVLSLLVSQYYYCIVTWFFSFVVFWSGCDGYLQYITL